jgi:hypothetical protein
MDAASDEIGILDSSPESTLDVAGRVGTRELQFRGGDGASDRINRMLGWGIGNTSSSGSTWRLVGTIDLPDSNYSSISLMVKTTYPGSNYGAYNASGYVWHNQANVTRKTTSVVDNANIYGPYNDKIQLHRNSVGQWELQARSVSDNQALAIEVTILSSSGGAGFDAQEGIVAGSTGGTTATPSGDMQYFNQLSSLQQYGSAVFNENGNDNDFRVESDGDTHALFVNAGDDIVCFGTSSGTGVAVQNTDYAAQITVGGRIFTCSTDHHDFNRTNNGEVIRFRHSATQVGSISVTNSATAYNTSSDARLKEKIADADDAGALIDAIQVRQFDWIADGEHQRYGMVAQELNTVAPEAVSEGETEEDMMAVDYSKLVPMLIKEIQSLRARVAQLESN